MIIILNEQMASKTGIIWIVIAIFYFVYSAILAKHGLMFINTAGHCYNGPYRGILFDKK